MKKLKSEFFAPWGFVRSNPKTLAARCKALTKQREDLVTHAPQIPYRDPAVC